MNKFKLSIKYLYLALICSTISIKSNANFTIPSVFVSKGNSSSQRNL